MNIQRSLSRQCDQFATWVTLGYFLLNQFSPKQAVSTHGFLLGILRFQIQFDVSDFQIKLCCRYFGIFGHFFPKIGLNSNLFSGHTDTWRNDGRIDFVAFKPVADVPAVADADRIFSATVENAPSVNATLPATS
jgi:hypothetical protein